MASSTVDRVMATNRGNPDAQMAVPDSQAEKFQSSTYFDIHTGKWMTFDPKTRSYVAA